MSVHRGKVQFRALLFIYPPPPPPPIGRSERNEWRLLAYSANTMLTV